LERERKISHKKCMEERAGGGRACEWWGKGEGKGKLVREARGSHSNGWDVCRLIIYLFLVYK
jgi:hypothetical protein